MTLHPIFHTLSDEMIQNALRKALSRAQDGELFLEHTLSEALVLDQGTIRQCSRSQNSGFGLRAVYDPFVNYAYGNQFDEKTLATAVSQVCEAPAQLLAQGYVNPESAQNSSVFLNLNPSAPSLSTRVKTLSDLDAYARQKDARVIQVQASLAWNLQDIAIHRLGHSALHDSRPMASLRVMVVLQQDGKRATGSAGQGGRYALEQLMLPNVYQTMVDEAVRLASLDLEAKAAPAGVYPVVLGSGWTGILLHEAIGHGLEGDSNRRKNSMFAGLLGEKIGAKGVTVVDDGSLGDTRGSLRIDDEGTQSQRTVLIEDGKLVGYMQDRMNGRMMGMATTGNCRREDFASVPLVRMTNTLMLAGPHEREEMIRSVDKGILALQFGGGEVDVSSGNFVFSATEAYWIEKGKIQHPVKGVTLLGNGAKVLKNIKMVGQDFALDPGIGTCGKDGQAVPVNVGQPSVLISELTVGGTEVS